MGLRSNADNLVRFAYSCNNMNHLKHPFLLLRFSLVNVQQSVFVEHFFSDKSILKINKIIMVPFSQFPTWPMNICILKWKPVNKTGGGWGERVTLIVNFQTLIENILWINKSISLFSIPYLDREREWSLLPLPSDNLFYQFLKIYPTK